MVDLPEYEPNTPAENEGILTGLGAGKGRRPVRGSGNKKQSFKTSASDFADSTDADSKAVIEGLKDERVSAPGGESVVSPRKWKVNVTGTGTQIKVPGAKPRNHFDDFMDLHDDLESAVMALGATTEDIPASKAGPGATADEQRGAYELGRSLLANASASMAKAGVAHTAGKYVEGGVSFAKTQPKVDKGVYDIANEVTPKIPGQYVKTTQTLTGKDGPQSAADHMKIAAASYGQLGNLLTGLSGAFGQKFKNSYGKSGRSYGDAANEIADNYAQKLSRNPEYASTMNAGSDEAWKPFSVKPIQRTGRTLFPGATDHDINASRNVQAAIDSHAYTMRKLEDANKNISIFNAVAGTRKVIARKAQDEAFATYAPNLAASEELDRKNDLADRKAKSEARAVVDAEAKKRFDSHAQAIADAHNETFPPMTEMYNGVQKLAIDAMDKGAELHKDVFKHLGNAYKSFGFHSAQVTTAMPYLADVTKHTNRAMDEVTNAARRLQQSGVNHPLLTQVVQDGAAQLAAGAYAGRLRTVNDGGFSAKPVIDTRAITNLPRRVETA